MSDAAKREQYEQAIAAMRERLMECRQGLEDLLSGLGGRRVAAMRAVFVGGRSVLFVMTTQLVRVDKDAFNTWNAPFVLVANDDPLLKFTRELRNAIEKRGEFLLDGTGICVGPDVEFADLLPPNPPPGVLHFVVADNYGRCGWEVMRPDGTTELVYTDRPIHPSHHFYSRFADPPTHHLGETIEDPSVEGIAVLYYRYLADLVDQAEANFLGNRTDSTRSTNPAV
ncbi:hypothetical protein [Iamia sp.]|uniref:hypothetical protein n=1 Tax=Iamia sp. TaxID=2722710 RepID=UPI002C27E433|nr:hypothetical protein [Iamia sp.]HXH58923.1 hypothetical protein [Iamia sp.]